VPCAAVSGVRRGHAAQYASLLRPTCCRSPLADEPSRAYRIAHTQNAPTAEPQDAPCPPVFARKRAPTAGSRAARCTPFLRCRSPLADEPSRAYRIVHTQNAPTAEPQDTPCPPCSRASALLQRAAGRPGARRFCAVGVRLRTNLLKSFGARRVRAHNSRGQIP